MSTDRPYYLTYQFSINKLNNIEDKKIIHEYENKNLTIELERLKEQYKLNQLR